MRDTDPVATVDAGVDQADDFEPVEPGPSRRQAVAGVPVVLADGKVWEFATPAVLLCPRFVPPPASAPWGKATVETDVKIGYRPEIDAALQAIDDARTADPDNIPYAPILGAAFLLLRECHDVSPPQAAALLECDPAGFNRILAAILVAVRTMPFLETDPDDPLRQR